MRPSVDEYYLGMADAAAKRAECTRRQVGAVIVKDRAIISTGYNGAAPGKPSCLDGACPRANSDAAPGTGYASSGCVAIHAEMNALLRASWDQLQGATLYCTDEPCDQCDPHIEAAGITTAIYRVDEFPHIATRSY